LFPLAKFKRVEDEDGNEDEDEDEEEEDEVEEDIEEKVRRDSLRLLGEDDDRLVDVAPSVLIPLDPIIIFPLPCASSFLLCLSKAQRRESALRTSHVKMRPSLAPDTSSYSFTGDQSTLSTASAPST
tara:strand:+ start:1065 stop:1445 length:381 start_codon:yes stop_codon:yes gene_type:complete